MTLRHRSEVGIVTADSARLVAFYRAAFGFTVDRELTFPQGTVHRLVLDDARLKVFQPAQSVGRPAPTEPWFLDGGMRYAALHVADVAASCAAAVAAGAVVLAEPTVHRPGAMFAMVRDPDGNCWELLHEPTEANH